MSSVPAGIPGSVKGFLGRAALALGSLVVALALLEGGARLLVEMSARRVEREIVTPISRYDAELGWINVPGSERRVARGEFDVTLRFNAAGLRGPLRSPTPAPGVRRTLVLGDSFAAGYYVDEEDAAAAVLEKLLAPCGPHEVINAGVQGTSTDQQYLLYLQSGRQWGARLVLLFFYGNDLRYNASPVGSGGEAKPYFVVDRDGRLVRHNQPVPPPPPGISSRARVGGHRPRPWRGSMALRLLSNRTVDGNPRLHEALARVGLVEAVSRDAPSELWPYGPLQRGAVAEMWSRTHAILRALRDAVQEDGATLAVVHVPARFEVNDDVWRLTRERYRLGKAWSPQRVRDVLRGRLAALGIPFVDPTDMLRQVEAAGRPAYFTRDVHWNATGNALAAHAIEPIARAAHGCPAR